MKRKQFDLIKKSSISIEKFVGPKKFILDPKKFNLASTRFDSIRFSLDPMMSSTKRSNVCFRG